MQKLDRRDIAILTALQQDGRMANRALAEQVGLSPSACHTRVRRLIDQGYIRGFTADIDLDRLCPNVEVFAEVTLDGHTHADFDRFERAVVATPEIVECSSVGGGHDYIVKFVCADLQAYETLSQDLIDRGIGIKRMFSYITIRKVKRTRGYPLPQPVND